VYTLTLTHRVWVLTLTHRKPGQTHTHSHGYRFGQVGVQVGQKYPRVTPVDHYITVTRAKVCKGSATMSQPSNSIPGESAHYCGLQARLTMTLQ